MPVFERSKLFITILLLLLILIVLLLLIHLPLFLHRRKYSYSLASRFKMDRLKSLQSPRILLIGDSNLAMGIDSERIEQELGHPVCDMGMGRRYGLYFVLREIHKHVQPGDILVYSPAYKQFFVKPWGNGKLLLEHAEVVPEAWSWYHKKQKMLVLKAIPETLAKSFRFLLRSIRGVKHSERRLFTVNALNEYGDIVAHLTADSPEKVTANVAGGEITWPDYLNVNEYQWKHTRVHPVAMKILERFFTAWHNRGATAFITFEPIRQWELDENGDKFETILSALRDLQNVNILGLPEHFTFGEEHFFDYLNHMNREGRQLRTEKMIQLLREAGISTRNPAGPELKVS